MWANHNTTNFKVHLKRLHEQLQQITKRSDLKMEAQIRDQYFKMLHHHEQYWQ